MYLACLLMDYLVVKITKLRRYHDAVFRVLYKKVVKMYHTHVKKAQNRLGGKKNEMSLGNNFLPHVFLHSRVALNKAKGLWVVVWECQSSTTSPLSPLHPPAHQAGEHGHHHLGLDLHQVVWESVDTRADLPRHGDGIFGVLQLVLG